MCGRAGYVNSDFKTYGIDRKPMGFSPIYNGAPSMRMPVLLNDGEKHVELYRFGLIPSWSKTPTVKFSTINATCERILTSPVYRTPIRTQRCLACVTHYFEWKKYADGTKKPFVFKLKSRPAFALGAVYDIWKDVEGKEIRSFSIVTTPPNSVMEQYHNRMPLILPKEKWDTWLSHKLNTDDIQKLMIPYENPENMEVYEVSTRVNSPANDDERILLPV